MKKCCRCKECKELAAFGNNLSRPDGLQSWCRECRRAYNKTDRGKATRRRYGTSQKGQAERRRYEASEKRKAYRRRYGAQNRLDRPELSICSHAIERAIRDGKITRPTVCTACGQPHGAIEGHHPDYDNPLDVVWLCRPCHRVHHALLRKDATL